MHRLFDLDGTLTNPFTGITRCIQHALAALGRPVPPADQLAWCSGPPLKESLLPWLLRGGSPWNGSRDGGTPNPELAESLKKIAKGGADVVYNGAIAQAIVKEFEKPGANRWITKEDLENFRVTWREPVQGCRA